MFKSHDYEYHADRQDQEFHDILQVILRLVGIGKEMETGINTQQNENELLAVLQELVQPFIFNMCIQEFPGKPDVEQGTHYQKKKIEITIIELGEWGWIFCNG